MHARKMRYRLVRVRIRLGPLEMGRSVLKIRKNSRHASGGVFDDSSSSSLRSLALPARKLAPVSNLEVAESVGDVLGL
jgi:hypothetical protein